MTLAQTRTAIVVALALALGTQLAWPVAAAAQPDELHRYAVVVTGMT